MLKNKKCVPCEGGIPPLTKEVIKKYKKEINSEWTVVDEKKIIREFRFVNFRHAMDFANKVTNLAEEENHHPELHIGYGKCTVELWTHAINGLSENDFILAAKMDGLI